MNTYANNTQENKSQSIANAISQKKSKNQSTFQFVDNRPEAVAQKEFQELANSSPQVKQLRAFQGISNTKTIQAMPKEKPKKGAAKPKSMLHSRPHFSGPARKLRKLTNSKFDLAHRISYHDIQTIVKSGIQQDINKLISILTIPQRDFGEYPIGYLGYYEEVIKLIGNEAELIKALNNSPFNLRPGIPSVNRSIGRGFDPNRDDSGRETPQSLALRPLAQTNDAEGRTSSLNEGGLRDWEKLAFRRSSI